MLAGKKNCLFFSWKGPTQFLLGGSIRRLSNNQMVLLPVLMELNGQWGYSEQFRCVTFMFHSLPVALSPIILFSHIAQEILSYRCFAPVKSQYFGLLPQHKFNSAYTQEANTSSGESWEFYFWAGWSTIQLSKGWVDCECTLSSHSHTTCTSTNIHV